MIKKRLSKKNDRVFHTFVLIILLAAIVMGTTMCTTAEAPADVSEEEPAPTEETAAEKTEAEEETIG